MRLRRDVLIAAGAAMATLLAGRWAVKLFTTSEFVHFSVNFPTAADAEALTREQVGGPWTRVREGDWKAIPPGGLLAWGREGRIDVDLGRQGVLKKLIQPWVLTLSTHWLRNVGTKPYRVRLELDMCGMPVEWETFEREWDPISRSATRDIPPRNSYNMDWVVHVPEERRNQAVVCEGGLKVLEASSGRLLTLLPIRVVNSAAGVAASSPRP